MLRGIPAIARLIVLTAFLGMAAHAGEAPLLHPKYHLPASSFAYVGDPQDPATWKLPYRHSDGSIDQQRLPAAIEAMIETWRGRRANVPAAARHRVLERLAHAADELGRMPPKAAHPKPLYRKLAAALR
ncbi:MAG: hypothetical protein ACREFQ_18165 [Stellaceae bacterium]